MTYPQDAMAESTSSPAARRPLAAVALMVLTAAGLFVAACGGGASEGLAGEGEPVPRFEAASLDGGTIGPQDYAGDVVLVDFWATWCVPCHAQADVLKPLYESYRGDGVEFLAVSLGEAEETVRSFVADNPFPYPVAVDPDDELTYDLGVAALPTLMVIDRAGKVVYFRPGVISEERLRDILSQAGA